mmetsp:Transcript_37132/g.66459  ORF Transcript_37132/g.66459 Transcript_37132/m.66459 type:complete len:210 (-) Transcript_37132:39-668(-)
MQDARRLEQSPIGHPWVHVLQEVVCMASCHAKQVHHRAAAQHHGERKQHPGQVGRCEVENAHQAEVDVLVPPAPHIYHHEGEGGAQELNVNKRGDTREERATKEQHKQKVSAAPPKAPLLQRLAVLEEEEYMEHEIQAQAPKKEKVGEEAPELPTSEYQLRVEVDVEGGYYVHRTAGGGEEGEGNVAACDWRQLLVPLLHGLCPAHLAH